jgi:hypothetical protein
MLDGGKFDAKNSLKFVIGEGAAKIELEFAHGTASSICSMISRFFNGKCSH